MRRVSGLFALLFSVLTALTACGDEGSGPPMDGDAGRDASTICTSTADCDDGLYCNGVEICAPRTAGVDDRGCGRGTPPCPASEACVEASDSCAACSVDDADGDGVSLCDFDCDDADAARHPGATELCDADARDEDCNPATYGFLDVDGDGYSANTCCNGTAEPRACGTDCDPGRPGVHPDASEVCDTLDNDCDGVIDEGVTRTFHPDVDGDGFGDPTGASEAGCTPPTGFVEDATDCDDAVAARNPGAPETCDGVDNDCDTVVDDSIGRIFYRDADHDGYGLADTTIEACSRPADYADRPGDCDDGAPARSPVLPEVCDGIDNDCDGAIDDSAASAPWYRDADGDGHGNASDVVSNCAPLSGRVLLAGDCDDGNASRNPAAPEVCDTVDNDCDAVVDDGVALPYYRDTDGDGFGVATDLLTACARPTGYSPLAGDCDDSASQRSPALPEFCDGVDNDCDGVVDDGIALPVWYRDADSDGYGRADVTSEACARPSGYRDIAGDCDDTNASRNPAAPEVCDSVDNDCDLIVDDGVLQTFYRDADLDGYGTTAIAVPGATTRACAQPVGYAAASTDCDDTRASRNPGAPEVCDGVDNNCNGLLDYPGEDPDGDGHTISACGGSDCDNTRADVYVGASELCDGRDNDCDGLLGTAEDVDRDGRARVACGGSDCNDADATVYAGAPERCDGLDNDCNGAFDGPGEDVDGDRYVAIACGGTDCNDANGAIHPGVAELCDAVDNDCNGALLTGEDDDGDRFADTACGGSDCDDARASVHPGADEGCDGLDTDCGGGLGAGEDVDRDGAARASCGAACVGTCGDCDDARAEVHVGAPELCDGRDDDCDGALNVVGEDDDRDGHADSAACAATCSGTCDDCDDTRASVHPGAPPTECDGLDNDCDGLADELDATVGNLQELGGAYLANDTVLAGDQQVVVATDQSGGSRNLVFVKFNPETAIVTFPRIFLTTALADEDNPKIAVAGPDFVIAYTSDASGSRAVYFMRVSATGSLLSGPVRLSTGTTNVGRPTLAVGGVATDRALIAWSQDGTNKRIIVRTSDGSTLAATADMRTPGAFPIAAWDATSSRFGVLEGDYPQYGVTLTLRRLDADGTSLGTDSVGATNDSYFDLAAVSGRFLVARSAGLGFGVQYWDAAAGGASTADVSVTASLGGGDPHLGVSPNYIYIATTTSMTARRRTDLGPVAGFYYAPSSVYVKSPVLYYNGRVITTSTHNGSYLVTGRHVCH